MSPNRRKSSAIQAPGPELAKTPHKAFMKLASLELEKTRHLQERASVLLRIHNIDERLRALNEEQRIIKAMFTIGSVAPKAEAAPVAAVPSAPVGPDGPVAGTRVLPLGRRESAAPATPRSEAPASSGPMCFRY